MEEGEGGKMVTRELPDWYRYPVQVHNYWNILDRGSNGGVMVTGWKQDTEKDYLQESGIILNTLNMMQPRCLECEKI